MTDFKDANSVVLFVLLFIPGFVSTRVYDLLISGQPRDYGKILYEVVGYSFFTYALLSPALLWWWQLRDPSIGLTMTLAFVALLLTPAVLPLVYLRLLRVPWLASRVVSPVASSWDWAFSVNPKAMVLLHLIDGRLIGGEWAGNSYVSTFPIPPDIYLGELWNVDQTSGEFVDRVLNTKGLVVWGKDIEMIEFFDFAAVRARAHGKRL